MIFTASEKIEERGYLVIKDFFSAENVEKLRALCLSDDFKSNDGVILGDIITHDKFRNIIFTDKLINFLKELLGGNLCYICDGTARGDDKPLTKSARKFHSDSRADDFDFQKTYSIYRLGIYLQDTNHYSGGLKVREKSHKRLCVDHGTFFEGLYRFVKYFQRYRKFTPISFTFGKNIETKAGDLVVWNMRLHHSGHAVRLKFFSKFSLPPFVENWVPKFLVKPEQDKRCVLFFAFGGASDYLDDYGFYIKKHESNISHWEYSNFSDEKLLILLNKYKIKLLMESDVYNNEESQIIYKNKRFF